VILTQANKAINVLDIDPASPTRVSQVSNGQKGRDLGEAETMMNRLEK